MQLILGADVDEAQRMVSDIGDRLDSRTVLDVMGDLVTEYESEVFDSNGHGTWAPLDPATVAGKGSGRILVDSGDLMGMLTSRPDVSGDSVAVHGTDYAGYLKAGARGMPKRDPAPEPDRGDTDRWAEQLLDFVVDGRR